MKHSVMTAIALSALSAGACSEKAETIPAEEASESVGAVPDTATIVSPAQMFANAAAASDAFEVETSKLAATRAESAKIKRFAEEMIKAHTESTGKLKTAAATASPAVTPVAELTPAQQQTLDALRSKSGAEFDTAYALAQVDAHQAALNGLKAYSANGQVPALKALATELVPVVTAHLNMAKGL